MFGKNLAPEILLIFWMRMTKNGCGQSGYKILKLNVSQE